MKKLFKMRNYIITVVMFAALVVVGSLFDYQIALKINIGPNLFSKILEIVGYFPASLLAGIGAIMILLSDNHRYKVVSFTKWFIAIGSFSYGFYYLYDGLKEILGSLIYVGVAALVLIGLYVLAYLLLRNCTNKNKLALFGLALISMVCAGNLVSIVSKRIFARPRMRLILSEKSIEFKNWWEMSRDIKEAYIAKGIASEEFKSFPSGHALNSCYFSALWTLCSFNEKLKNKEGLIFIIGLFLSLLTSFSRMLCGAHFLTDVTFGMMACLFCQFVCYKVYLRKLD